MESQVANIDQILEHYIGGVGLYQILITVVLYHASWGGANHVYTAYAPDHRCRVSECEEPNQTKTSANIFDAPWLEFAIPQEDNHKNFLDTKTEYDGCKMFKRLDKTSNENVCTPQHFNESNTEKCQDFIFDNTYFDETLATKFNLVCENKHYKSLLGTLFIIALLFGSLIGGRIGDKYGRIKAYFISQVFMTCLYLPMGYVQYYEGLDHFSLEEEAKATYATMYFFYIMIAIISGVNVSAYIAEMYTSKWRFVTYIIAAFPTYALVTSLILYLNRTFSGIHLWGGLVSLCNLPFYFIIPESPRWLAQNNREEEALKTLITMAKVNRRNITDEDKSKIEKVIREIADESHKTEDSLSPLDMMRHGNLSRSLNLFFAWTMACVSYYALSFSAADLSGHIILNFLLSRLISIPENGLVAWGINLIGRKKTLVASHTFLGVMCIGLAFIPKDFSNIILVIYLLASMAAGISFAMVYLITIELYPTNMRTQALGTCSAFARIFCACAPFLTPLSAYWQPLPMLIVGVPIIISGLLAIKLPETYNENLPQTIKGAIDMEKRQQEARVNEGFEME